MTEQEQEGCRRLHERIRHLHNKIGTLQLLLARERHKNGSRLSVFERMLLIKKGKDKRCENQTTTPGATAVGSSG